MDETEFIWMDGKLVKWKDAKIHVLTHTLHYGLGVFEGIRFYKTDKGPAVFRLKEHIQRLFNGAKVCFMDVPFSEEQIVDAVKETIIKNKIDAGYIRPIFFYGYGKMGLDPKGSPVNASIAVWPWGSYLGEDAVKVKTSSFIRIHPKSSHVDAKICGHYVNSIFASVEAKKAGYEEALLLDHTGGVSEGPGENFFCVKDGKIYTPPKGNILPGITRDSIMKIAKDEGIAIVEKELSLDDLKEGDELFFTGTAAEVTAISSLDDKKIGDGKIGPIISKLKDIYMGAVIGKNKKYESWLSYVNK